MINILHTIDTTGPGGAESVFLQLIHGLDKERFRSFAAIPGKGWVYDRLVKGGLTPMFINASGSFSVRYLLQLIDIIRRHDIDIIQSHLFGSNVYCSLAGMICRRPVISTFHGFVDAEKRDRFLKIKFSLINRGSKKIVFVSEQLRKHYLGMHGLNEGKAVTIHNGVDLAAYSRSGRGEIRKELGLGRDHVLIGSIGNIRPAKGYDHLLRAASLIAKHHPECRFVIAGQGSGALYEGLLRLKKELGLDDKVHFIGFRDNIHDILSDLDIFVLPSTSEGFSIVTLEAIASRVPVIITRSGGPEEIVDKESGILVSPGNEQELADAIGKMIADKRMRIRVVRNAYDIVQKKFSLQSLVEKYEGLYCSVLSSGSLIQRYH